MAKRGQIRLAIPACALFEPYGTLVRRHGKRDALLKELRRDIEELSRSAEFSQLPGESAVVLGTLFRSGDAEICNLESTIKRVAEVATVIPLTREIVESAPAQWRSACKLSPSDAIVFESIDAWLQAEADESKVFSTRDARAFTADGIREHLRKHNCRVIRSFADTLAFVEHRLAEDPPARADA